MAQILHIKTKCPQCNGTGVYTPHNVGGGGGGIPCPMCSATGWLDVPPYVQKIVLDPGLDDIGDNLDDINVRLDDVIEKCNDILEKLG
jgi:hypothetical protein